MRGDPRSPRFATRVAHTLTPALLCILGIAGCEATPDAVTAKDGTNLRSKAAADREHSGTDADGNASETALALRAQADRDMDALRELREKARLEMSEAADDPDAPPGRRTASNLSATGPGGDRTIGDHTTGDHTIDPGPATPRKRPEIQWNDPPAAVATTTALPLARPEDADLDVRPAPGALTAAEQLELDTLGMRLVRLRQDLYRESIDSDQPVRELLAIAAMAIVDPDLKLPQGADRSLTAEELELLGQLHSFFMDLGRKLDSTHEAEETIVAAVAALQDAIVKKPQLELPTVALCWRIGGFGDYDRFERESFLAQDEQQVILYLEIDGFTSVLNQRNQWVTQISQQLEIYSDRDGIPVWSEPWQKAVDVINNRRRDFFTTQLFTLPRALGVGKYHLKIRVRDEESGAEAEASIPFDMVADPKMAARVGK